ncbi:MAG: hypothetical protein LIP23_00760, partial [Planctomycetes bacterium]|nr:hypothetical protein [Planctomycetota bacterium]
TVSSLSNREDENPVELKNSVRLSMPAPIERSRGSARVVTIESIGPDGFIDFSTAKKINDYSMPVEPEWTSSELPSFLTDRTDIVAAAPALDGFSPILPDLQPEGIVDRDGDGEFSSRFGLPGKADLQAALATLPRLADQTPQSDDFGGLWVDGFDFMSEAGPALIQTGPEAMRIEPAEIPASEDHYWSQLPSPNDIPFFHGDHELQLIAP